MKRFNTPLHHVIEGIQFKFEYIYTPMDNKFFVTATDAREIPVCFEMKKDAYGKWTLIQPIPFWISELEGEIIECLKYNLQILMAA